MTVAGGFPGCRSLKNIVDFGGVRRSSEQPTFRRTDEHLYLLDVRKVHREVGESLRCFRFTWKIYQSFDSFSCEASIRLKFNTAVTRGGPAGGVTRQWPQTHGRRVRSLGGGKMGG